MINNNLTSNKFTKKIYKKIIPRISKSARAGLDFPVARIGRYLKKGRYGDRIGIGSAIYMAATLEYLTAELLELSGGCAKAHNKKRIIPRHIQLAVRYVYLFYSSIFFILYYFL